MKTILYFLLIVGIIFYSCDKLIPDLPRDNPLDGNNDTVIVEGVSVKYASHNIVFENNGDGLINKGETVYLKVFLINNGSNTANSVKATFSINSSYVSQLTPISQIIYGDIEPGSTQYVNTSYAPNYQYYTIKFIVSNTTPANTQIPISINIIDADGNTWSSNFNVTVQNTNAQIAYGSHNVVYDNNEDGIINDGETVYLKVFLLNNGSSDANSVKATFAINSSYVSQLSPTSQVTFGDIAAGNTQYANTGYAPNYQYYTIMFTVSNTTPANTQIPISISLTDDTGNTWPSSFNVTVQNTNAQIAYSIHNIVYDNNENGIINKGETVYLKVFLTNNGSSKANSVKATFSINSSYVSQFSPTSQVTYGDIEAGSSQYFNTGFAPNYQYYTLKFTVSSTTPSNTVIPINISIIDECSNTWSSSFNVTVYQ